MALAIIDRLLLRRELRRQRAPLPEEHPSLPLARAVRARLAERIAPVLGLLKDKQFGFAFTDNDVPDALVIPLSNTACLVTISAGLLDILELRMGQLLTVPTIATRLGAPSPDSMRRCLLLFALEFILCHEVGHVLQGHLDVRGLRRRRRSLSERHMMGAASEEDASVSQLCEIQADRAAVTYSLHRWLDEADKRARPPSVYGVEFRTKEELRDAWTLSISTLFVLLGVWTGTEEDFFGCTHPFPAYRLARIFAHRPVGSSSLSDQIGPHERVLDEVASTLDAMGLDLRAFRISLSEYARHQIASQLTTRLERLPHAEAAIVETQLEIADFETAPGWATHFFNAMENGGKAAVMVIGRELANAPQSSEAFRRSAEFRKIRESQAFSTLERVYAELPADVFQEMVSDTRADPRLRIVIEATRRAPGSSSDPESP